MYKIVVFCCCLVSTLTARAQKDFTYTPDFAKIAAQTADVKSPLYYPVLRKRFAAHDQTLTTSELLAVQIGHTQQPIYRPYSDIDVERKLYELNDKGDFPSTLELATFYQRRNPFSLMLNLEKSYAFAKTGQRDSATIYITKYKRLIETLLASGDGEKRPYFILSPIDGQILITRFWRGELGLMGSSSDKQGNMLDMLEMTDEAKGKNKTYLFHIEHASATMFK